MINEQWEKCRVCGRDKKYVMFNGPNGRERLVCKLDCVQLISRMEVYNILYEVYKNELKCRYDITDDKASRKANIYAVKNTDLFFNNQHMNWNGYTIKASKEVYDKLVEDGYTPESTSLIHKPFNHYIILANVIVGVDGSVNKTDKKFYLVNNSFTKEEPTGSCSWKRDEWCAVNNNTNVYSTECGNLFEVGNDETPKDNGFKVCPYYGKEIQNDSE